MTTPPRRPSPASRATRRSRRTAARSSTFLERNRTRLLWAGGIVAAVLLVGIAYLSFTRPTYACLNEWAPTTAPSFVAPSAAPASGSPAPAVTAPPPGYVQPDMGHVHANPGTTIRFTSCPPASGRHYNGSGIGPILAGLYGPDEAAAPPGWIHNLEHGALVLLYRCPGPGCTDEGQRALQDLLVRWPNSPICNVPPGQLTPVMARFDEMAWDYAAIVWDVVLPMTTIDESALFDFYARQGEQFNPEPQCPDPTATPGPTPTAGPPTASPAASQPASPAASPAATPPAGSTPASSTAPSPS